MARNRQRAKDRKQRIHRDNIPGSLDNASGEVEAVEARIVAGADGVVLDSDGHVDADDALDREELGRGAGHVAAPPDARQPSGFRLVNFFRACWAELQRVQWPDRHQVGQATAVVLGFVVIAGAFLGLADEVAKRIVDLII